MGNFENETRGKEDGEEISGVDMAAQMLEDKTREALRQENRWARDTLLLQMGVGADVLDLVAPREDGDEWYDHIREKVNNPEPETEPTETQGQEGEERPGGFDVSSTSLTP